LRVSLDGGGGGGSNIKLEISIEAQGPPNAGLISSQIIDGPAQTFLNEFAFETRTGLLLASLAKLRWHAKTCADRSANSIQRFDLQISEMLALSPFSKCKVSSRL
jgi:hypothetical protein